MVSLSNSNLGGMAAQIPGFRPHVGLLILIGASIFCSIAFAFSRSPQKQPTHLPPLNLSLSTHQPPTCPDPEPLLLARSRGAPQNFFLAIHDPAKDIYTSLEIVEKGTWHPQICQVIKEAVDQVRRKRKWLKKVTVMDIGANIGYISLWASGLGEDVQVISVEPHPAHNSLFSKSLALPSNTKLASRIQLHKFALSAPSEAGKYVCMQMDATNAAKTFVSSPSGNNTTCEGTEVEVTTADRILQDGRIKPDVVKIDVEGFEYNVFAGAQWSLLRNLPAVIVMEYNYFMLKSLYPRPPVEWLVGMFKRGYTIKDLATGTRLTDETGIRAYFAEASFLEKVPSSHTDLVLSLSGF